jgi:ABC-type dipeptide/oligopeptide/nickel transport system permease component
MTRFARPGLFVARRLFLGIGTLLTLATVVFLLLKAIPGDEARVAAGEWATPDQVAAVRVKLGLDRGLPSQYLRFLGRLAHGDLGVSSSTHGSVASAIADQLPSTAEVVIVAVLISVSVAVPLAAFSALRSSGAWDSTRRVSVMVLAGMPTFWLALLAQSTLSAKLGIFPISGQLSVGFTVPHITGAPTVDALLSGNFAAAQDAFSHVILPAMILSIPQTGLMYRVTRSEILRALTRQHITVARAAGVGRARLIRKHILPLALTPVIILVGVDFGTLFSTAILVESVFGRPGLGSTMTNAIRVKDTLTVEGCVLVIGLIVVVSNLGVDLVQWVRDPRVRAAEVS